MDKQSLLFILDATFDKKLFPADVKPWIIIDIFAFMHFSNWDIFLIVVSVKMHDISLNLFFLFSILYSDNFLVIISLISFNSFFSSKSEFSKLLIVLDIKSFW